MDKLENNKLAIIGVGHMGNALRKGLLNSGFKKENIILSNQAGNNKKAAMQAAWIILVVKPLIAHQVIEEIKDSIHDKLLISAAAAVSIRTIEEYTKNKKQKIIRIMPNINVAYNNGVIAFYANKFVSGKDKKQAISLLSMLGTVIEVKNEQYLDSLTLISACGPAVVSYFIKMLSKVALSIGFAKIDSELIALKTFSGTLTYLQNTKFSHTYLQNIVATKGGITEEILKSMDMRNLFSLFNESINSGKDKLDKLRKAVNYGGNN